VRVTADLALARLRVFHEVAVRGSFTAAATALRLTEPAVSQQVAKLEKELGAVLLERCSRSVVVTAPGRVLLGHVDAVLARQPR
jgi:DNA-binding transcriptional LysR family regulator